MSLQSIVWEILVLRKRFSFLNFPVELWCPFFYLWNSLWHLLCYICHFHVFLFINLIKSLFLIFKIKEEKPLLFFLGADLFLSFSCLISSLCSLSLFLYCPKSKIYCYPYWPFISSLLFLISAIFCSVDQPLLLSLLHDQ